RRCRAERAGACTRVVCGCAGDRLVGRPADRRTAAQHAELALDLLGDGADRRRDYRDRPAVIAAKHRAGDRQVIRLAWRDAAGAGFGWGRAAVEPGHGVGLYISGDAVDRLRDGGVAGAALPA